MKKSKKEIFDIVRILIGVITLIILIPIEIIFGDSSLGPSDINTLIILPISIVLYLLLTYEFFIRTYKNFKKKRFFDEITLTLIASIAALAINQPIEGLAVALFFIIGEKFEDYAINKSRKSISDVLDLRSDKANKVSNYKQENEIKTIVDPYEVEVNDVIYVKAGERVPLDGVVIEGDSFADTSSLTGESVPRKIKAGDEALSGIIIDGSPIYIRVSKPFYESTTSKIMDLVENATNTKTNNEKFITKFSKYYTPVVIILAFLMAVIAPFFGDYTLLATWQNSIYNAASLLVVSCPCALVLSVPMAYFVGIGEASKVKMIIKGSSFLEKLASLNTIILDKTGTITKGNFVVSEIYPKNQNISKDEILALAKLLEKESNHPIAKSILAKDSSINLEDNSLSEIKEIEGKGLSAIYKDKLLLVGNEKLLEDNNIDLIKNNEVGTIVYVSYNNEFLGSILIKDEIKDDSVEAINKLKENNVKDIYMLTGDNEKTASYIASKVNITSYKANLLPLDKVDEVKNIKSNKENKVIAFVGDGINDAPSMAICDLGISMGAIGSDAAIEASDIVIMDDKLSTIYKGKKISKKTLRVVYENIVFALLIKFIAVILASINTFIPILGTYMMWISIFADVGVTIICVCNSLRLMLNKKKQL